MIEKKLKRIQLLLRWVPFFAALGYMLYYFFTKQVIAISKSIFIIGSLLIFIDSYFIIKYKIVYLPKKYEGKIALIFGVIGIILGVLLIYLLIFNNDLFLQLSRDYFDNIPPEKIIITK